MGYAKALLHPPIRLRALSDGWARWLQRIWTFLFGLSVLTVVASAMYAYRASFWIQPLIQQHGLDFDVTTDGKLLVGTLPDRAPAIPVTGKVVAVDGKPVPTDLRVARLAELLDKAPGPIVEIALQRPDGRIQTLKRI